MKIKTIIAAIAMATIATAAGAQTTKGSGTGTYNRKLTEVKALIGQMTIEEKISQLTNWTPGVERLGIKPYNWWNESLHGVARNGRATVFPMPIGLGATFDPSLIHLMGDAISTEARAKFIAAQRIENYAQYAGLTFWSPNINIFRDARWGRGMETYGEDPYLTGTMGTAYVMGLQGNDPFYLKAAACAKHYAVHSGPEGTRHSANVEPSKHDLYETYLPAFKQLVQRGHVESVMGAYNRVYGESASGSKLLLTDILRRDWGFNGHVVSDCGAVTDIYEGHRIAKSEAEAAAIALKNGLNVECGSSMQHLQEALDEGILTEKDLDEALIPLFMTKAKLGILTEDPDCPYNNVDADNVNSDRHASIALKAAEESMVLLKNKDNLLPLSKEQKTMFIMGPAATDVFYMMGNYFGLSGHYTSYLEGIISRVSMGTTVNYKQGFLQSSPSDSANSWAIGEFLGADVSVLFVGNNGNTEGEEGDAISSPATGDRSSLDLPESQREILQIIKDRRRPEHKIITVVTGGSPLDLKLVEEISDAVIFAWYPGQEGGEALGRLMFGEADFSGRLPITFPSSLEKIPALDDYSMMGRTYKYQSDNIMYPFGYGLTYGDISYGDVEINNVDRAKNYDGKKALAVSCNITNSGQKEATEVAQLYLSAPGAGVDTPIASLIGFTRVTIPAGQSRVVNFTITPEQLQTVQADGTSRLLKGTYTIHVSAAAPGTRTMELGVACSEKSISIK